MSAARSAFLDLMRSSELDLELARAHLDAGKQASGTVAITAVPDGHVDAVVSRALKSAEALRQSAKVAADRRDSKVACILRMAELVNRLTPC